ncbi:MAG: hypothetical protein ACKOU6_00155 [Planctomycetota bacterium]
MIPIDLLTVSYSFVKVVTQDLLEAINKVFSTLDVQPDFRDLWSESNFLVTQRDPNQQQFQPSGSFTSLDFYATNFGFYNGQASPVSQCRGPAMFSHGLLVVKEIAFELSQGLSQTNGAALELRKKQGRNLILNRRG